MKKICRGCNSKMQDRALLTYKNMPKSAQFFPEADSVEQEKGVDIVLYQCPHCGLVQAIGEPVPYYRDVIRATGVSVEMKLFREKQYKDWVDTYGLAGKKVLEVGCGSGEYMSMMETTGAKVSGIEHLTSSVEAGRTNEHDIIEAFIEDEDTVLEEAPYDGFYSMNFLEHIPNPGMFLRGIAENLSDEAVGLIEVPNFDMMLEKMLYSEFIQDHLSYFTKDTLIGLLERNGFEVISCESIWYDYILSAVVKKRVQTDISGLINQHEALKQEMKLFLQEQSAQGKKVAVWGAGHQALANLSLLEMADSIEYVVDSASFKQGKFTPATHIPIVAPEHLATNDVQMVIIMAAGYSQEVKQIMKRDYPQIESVIFSDNGIEREKKDLFGKFQRGGKRFVIDIDGVIAKFNPQLDYANVEPNEPMIVAINKLYDMGNEIIIFTARGYVTGKDWRAVTEDQFARWGLKYHELHFGKPNADYYIDDKMLDMNVFLETLQNV